MCDNRSKTISFFFLVILPFLLMHYHYMELSLSTLRYQVPCSLRSMLATRYIYLPSCHSSLGTFLTYILDWVNLKLGIVPAIHLVKPPVKRLNLVTNRTCILISNYYKWKVNRHRVYTDINWYDCHKDIHGTT